MCRGINDFEKEYQPRFNIVKDEKGDLVAEFHGIVARWIRRVQVNQDGLKLSGTHQLLAYADDVNILAGSIHTLKENAGALVAATREI